MNHASASKNGFTLIEILIASAIFLTLIVALYSSYSQVIKTRGILSQRGEEDFYIRLLVQRLNQELSSLIFNPQGIASSFDGETNSISFYTSSPSLYYPSNPLTHVTYFLKEGKIYRKEEPYLSINEKEGKSFPIVEGVKEVNFSYFDGNDFWEKWKRENSLPSRIKIRIKIKSNFYSTSFYIPIGREYSKLKQNF